MLGDMVDKIDSVKEPAHEKAKEILDKFNISSFVVLANHDLKQGKIFGEPHSFLSIFGGSLVIAQYKKAFKQSRC
jgi:hypothetical protein